MVLYQLSVPGRPTDLDSRERATRACSRCGWGLFGQFSLICQFFHLSPSLGDGPIYSLKGPLSPKQPTIVDGRTGRQGQLLRPRNYRHGGIEKINNSKAKRYT